jgi:hypothetical protein
MEKSVARVGGILLGLCWIMGCGPIEELKSLNDLDLSPPVLMGTRTLGSDRVELLFDEPAVMERETVVVDPELEVFGVRGGELQLVIRIAAQIPGQRYSLRGSVADTRGNSMRFLTTFYGHNARVPAVRINEFTTRGTGNHPDVVELKVTEEGNMAGLVLYQGTPSNYEDRLVFPAFFVGAGDFILVHFKPQGISEELDETETKVASGGLDASDLAFDFWVEDGRGLSGNNGVITLYDRPGGTLLDAVLYSNRTSASDERYFGFGTRDTMERALELQSAHGWVCEEQRIRPEDGIDPEGSTGTRSLCRGKGPDSNTRHDWHIVPTGGFSFGAENSEEVYEPEG